MLTKVIIYTQGMLIYTFGYICHKLTYVLIDDMQIPFSEAIFASRITTINSANDTAFIEYLPDNNGYINLQPTSKLQSGSKLLATLGWAGNATKQPKFIYGVQIVGKYVVYLGHSINKVSAKYLPNDFEDELDQLSAQYAGKWILRSFVKNKSELKFAIAEMDFLYPEIVQINNMTSLGQRYVGTPKYLRLIREILLAKDCEIICNNEEINQQLLDYQDLWQIDAITIDKQLDCTKLITQYNDKLCRTEVLLSNGASLNVHTVSGINIIDVDSNNLIIRNEQLNFIILDSIYTEICIRNLYGIILIDFIKNMPSTAQKRIVDYLNKKFSIDIIRVNILGFTKAGLFEIIRNKF